MWQERLAQLVTTCHWIGAKGWAPATGGNMSVRQDDTWCWLSESGRDKGSLTTEDFLQVEIATNQAPSGRKPSAETGLHTLSTEYRMSDVWPFPRSLMICYRARVDENEPIIHHDGEIRAARWFTAPELREAIAISEERGNSDEDDPAKGMQT